MTEEEFITSHLNENCLKLYQSGVLKHDDALVVAKLPRDKQDAFATKCMRDFNVTGLKLSQLTKGVECIDGISLKQGSITYSMR